VVPFCRNKPVACQTEVPVAHARADNVRSDILRELIRANDPVLVSAVGALLDGAGIHYIVLDQNMSVIEGSIGILPRRIMVGDQDVQAARSVLIDAGLGHELRPE
jgi:hypothetical protein